MADRFDLKAARAERSGEPIPFDYDGVEFDVPPELPLIVGEYLAKAEIRSALRVLTGSDDIALELLGKGLSSDDLEALLAKAYPKLNLPESSASSTS